MMRSAAQAGWNLEGRLGLNASDVQILYSGGSLVLALVLVIVTIWYAVSTGAMVQEMRHQRRLGLYDRRANVLRRLIRALGYTTRDGRVPAETITGLLEAGSEKEFLFDEDLCDHLDEIYRKCVHAYTLHLQLEGLHVGPERTRVVSEASELLTWIAGQPAELRARFKPYLRAEDFAGGGAR